VYAISETRRRRNIKIRSLYLAGLREKGEFRDPGL
jgi:hypothetical protein